MNQQQIMRQVQQMQASMAQAQAEIAATEVSGSAGGGMVTATVTGTGDLKAIKIDPGAVDPDDSDIAVEQTPGNVLAATTDGGRTWTDVSPPADSYQFINPFVVDPLDSRHLFTAGTSVHEKVGGPTSWQALECARLLAGVNIVGADLVEVSPPFDPTGGTAFLGASLMFEMLCAIAVNPYRKPKP